MRRFHSSRQGVFLIVIVHPPVEADPDLDPDFEPDSFLEPESDDNSRLTEVTDANNHATRFAYDALDRQVGVTLAKKTSDGGK